MVTPCILSPVMLLWVHMSVHTCGTQIASEIGPYKMGNCFEYEAGQEKVEKIIIESKEKDAVKKNA